MKKHYLVLIFIFFITLCSLGFSEDLKLPEIDIIKLLESQSGENLQRYEMKDFHEWGRSRGGYATNERDEVTALWLVSEMVEDVNLLKNFSKLQWLDLSAINLIDISSLSDLKHLEVLKLCSAKLSDISPLGELINLKELHLFCMPVKNILPLKNLRGLEKFSLKRLDISNINAIKNLTGLVELELEELNVSNMEPLAKLKDLVSLKISIIEKSLDLSSLKSLSNLEELDIRRVDKIKLPSMTLLQNLKFINLSVIGIKGLQNLKSLLNLRELYVSAAGINNVSFLSNLKNLENLSIGGIEVLDLGPFGALSKLEFLRVTVSRGADLSPLGNLKNLRYMDLYSNFPKDVNFLKELNQLENITLRIPNISDISPLKNLKDLRKINIGKLTEGIFPSSEYRTDITSLPPWIVDWNPNINLHSLFFYSPLEYPTLEIVKQGREALKKYFEKHSRLSKLSDMEIIKRMKVNTNGTLQEVSMKDLKKYHHVSLHHDDYFPAYAVNENGDVIGLRISDSDIKDFGPMEYLDNLTWLEIKKKIPARFDLAFLRGLKNLKYLILKNINWTVDLTPLKYLTSLQCLKIDVVYPPILPFLDNLTQLEELKELHIETERISNLPFIKNMKNLKILDWKKVDEENQK